MNYLKLVCACILVTTGFDKLCQVFAAENEPTKFLGSDGNPNDALFVEDKLHHNAGGYKIRTRIVNQHLKQN